VLRRVCAAEGSTRCSTPPGVQATFARRRCSARSIHLTSVNCIGVCQDPRILFQGGSGLFPRRSYLSAVLGGFCRP
jgi:hypothetical protein